uniref:Methyltransferase n=1 Tax=viral metagenome TaxID=1070528 RepID=A0A6C0JJZ3_9ZZZZ
MDVISAIEKNTPTTSGIVKTIVKTMDGNTFHQHFHILYTLRSLIEKDEVIYTEIGSYHGGSLCLMLQHPSKVKCISIDPFHIGCNTIDIINSNIARFNIHNYDVELTKKFSTDKSLAEDLRSRNFKTDILFIDGDHSYDAVIHDFTVFSEFVAPGGFVVFDDYHDSIYCPGVNPAVNDIVKNIRDNSLPFEIIGSPPNFCKVYPLEFVNLNEFILRKHPA